MTNPPDFFRGEPATGGGPLPAPDPYRQPPATAAVMGSGQPYSPSGWPPHDSPAGDPVSTPPHGTPTTGWAAHNGDVPEGWAAPAGARPAADTGGSFPADGSSYAGLEETLLVSRRRAAKGHGWRRAVSKLTAGRINPGPSAKQEKAAELIERVRASLLGVHKVAFVCAKGGVGKTTMTVAVGSAIARVRGDRVIAVDVNTDLGDLSYRFSEQGGPQANIEALLSLQHTDRYSNVRSVTVQNGDRLEMLAAQNDPRSTYTLGRSDYTAAMQILETHYNVILLDCGTAITTPLFPTIANDVTSLVLVAAQTVRGVNGALNTLHWLHAHGFGRLLPRTVVALNSTEPRSPLVDLDTVDNLFRQHVPNIVKIPYDVHLAEGMAVDFGALKPRTRKALMELADCVAQSYPARQVRWQRGGDEPRREH